MYMYRNSLLKNAKTKKQIENCQEITKVDHKIEITNKETKR